MAKTVAILNQKGGVGKTTTAVNLTACVGAEGKRTLLCDIDPQGNSTSGFGVDKRSCEKSSYHVLIGECPVADALLHTEFQNVDLLPSTMDLAGADLEIVDMPNRERLLKNALCRPLVLRLSDERCACSRVSAEWIYGKAAARRVRVIRDGIPADRFRYDPHVREELRKMYSIPETGFVVGYVANFYPVKNHGFLLEVFAKVLERESDAWLLLVGDGEEKDRIRACAERMKLADRVIFTGTTDRVPDYLQMMDVFVFPSGSEGFGLVSVEAQAAGLPVAASDRVPEETRVTDDVVFLPLTDGADAWAETVLGFRDRIRADGADLVRAGGFEIRGIAEEIRKLYFTGSEGRK